MQTERVTFLASPAVKARMMKRAEASGVSLGEYIRRKADEDDDITPEQEAELSTLAHELEQAMPEMREDIAAMRRSIGEARAAIAAYRAEKDSLRKVAA